MSNQLPRQRRDFLRTAGGPAAAVLLDRIALAFVWFVLVGLCAEAVAQGQRSDAAAINIIKDVSYGPHGVRNLMDLYLPQAEAAPLPLVICIHGGGWAGGDKEAYAWLGEAFAQKGFAAVSITYRFAPAWRAPTQMDDVQRAVRWLRKNATRYGLDPERFGAIGGSAGAHLASYLALAETRDNSDPEPAAYSSRVQCVVDCYGPVDLPGMMRSASAPIVQGFIGKPLEGHEEDYRKASAVSYVGNNPPPFLIVHGTRDVGTSRGEVPIEQSIEFYEKLRKAGSDVTLLKLEGAGHGFSHKSSNQYSQATLAAAIEFFAKHLKKNVERP
jgi:acetyl esterase/lipase